MKLETEFVKLPVHFDVEQLSKEVAQFSDRDWMAHATGFAGNWSIPLISLGGEYNDALSGPMKATPALGHCDYIRQIMTEFGEVFSRSRLMRLDGGAEVPPHVDGNYHWYNRVRMHIPVTTTKDVLFYCGDHHVHMAAGECWVFNSWKEHAVRNLSNKTRVHLVLDTAGSTKFWDLVEQGAWPFKDRATQASEPRFIRFEPDKPNHIRTENYNAPLVQSPGELENLIKDLVNDVECATEAEQTARDHFIRIAKGFIWSWREVWSEHGMKPSGWPKYHLLVSDVNNAVASVTPELILASNGIELSQAFRGLVTYSAINEEFAPQYLNTDDLPSELKKVVRHFAPNKGQSMKNSEDASPPRFAEESSVDVQLGSSQPGRNEPCSCGSGKRYKHCHGRI